MSEERWDVPNERLRRIAETPEMPMARACPHCKHRHQRGELCGHLLGTGDGTTCKVPAVIPGPFVTMVRGAEDAIAMRRAQAPECSRCGSADRLRYFAQWDDIFGLWSARALCYRCDDLGLTTGSRPRSSHSSLRAFYLWLLAAFAAGVLLTLLAQAALSAVASTVSLTSAVDVTAVRAERMVEARAHLETGTDADRVTPSLLGPSTGSARTTSTDPTCETRPDDPGGPRGCYAAVGDNDRAAGDGAHGHDAGGKSGEGRASPIPRSLVDTITAAALEFGLEPEMLQALAGCESSTRAVPKVGDAQEIGWFQWLPSTWESNAPRLGYTILDITDPVAQARLTAHVLSEDGGWRWSCAR